MSEDPYAQDFLDLPEVIPIFPLHGVLLLPRGQLPLNIFEERYLEMVEDAMRGHRFIGMIQPEKKDSEYSLFKTGCAGKITSFQETEDKRYLITLTGVCRFEIEKELGVGTKYRQVSANWSRFHLHDMKEQQAVPSLDRTSLIRKLKKYFSLNDLTCNWEHIGNAPDERLVTCLSMICPFDPGEKQALLEAPSNDDRADKLMAMLEIAVSNSPSFGTCPGKCH